MTEPEIKPIFIKPPQISDDDNPFETDLFDRGRLVSKLNNLINRLPYGGVISIDAPWGEGKSWFGKNWQISLKKDGYKTAFIDAFQEDFIEDPFLMIASHMIEALDEKENDLKKNLIEYGSKVAINIIPAATKVGLKAFTRWVFKTEDVGSDLKEFLEDVNANVSKNISESAKELLTSHKDYIGNVREFKGLISRAIAADSKPFVVFIDELDRCRPDFAVKTLERIKHLFDIDGLVFVLLVNKDQLLEAVKGFYGQNIDAEAYLRKFVQFSLMLPKLNRTATHTHGDNEKFCTYLFETKYEIETNDQTLQFRKLLLIFANHFRMSLRDLDNAIAFFLLSSTKGVDSMLVSWPIALKIGNIGLFERIVQGDRTAHQDAANILSKIQSDGNDRNTLISFLRELHLSHALDRFDQTDNELNRVVAQHYPASHLDSILPRLFGFIELTLT